MFHTKNKLNTADQQSGEIRRISVNQWFRPMIIMCQSVVLILACSFFFFSGPKPASAESLCQIGYEQIKGISDKECSDICQQRLADKRIWTIASCRFMPDTKTPREGTNYGGYTDDPVEIAKNIVIQALNWLLLAILKFLGWILSVAAAIFAWAADANSLSAVINGPLIYESWGVVRDLLNIAFIMMLLYTAFTIIFQVDKTNKKIILTVVLMALLVNFSFPISRFIIDIGNSLMFTIFKNLLPTTDTIFSNFAENSALADIIHPAKASTAQLVGSVVFVGILAITFLMMAMLFLLRIVALAIIIIFSPIGFVGVIFPSVSSKIDWWGNLFKYTFFGPAMAFMIYIATKIMTTAIDAQWGNNAFAKFGQDPSGGDLISSMSTFAIPVVVLWIGMGVAQKMGIEGAAVAQKWATAAFNKVSGVGFAKDTWKAYRARRDQAKEDSWSKKLGTFAGSQQDRARGNIIGGKDAELRYQKDLMAKVKKEGEETGRMLLAIWAFASFVASVFFLNEYKLFWWSILFGSIMFFVLINKKIKPRQFFWWAIVVVGGYGLVLMKIIFL